MTHIEQRNTGIYEVKNVIVQPDYEWVSNIIDPQQKEIPAEMLSWSKSLMLFYLHSAPNERILEMMKHKVDHTAGVMVASHEITTRTPVIPGTLDTKWNKAQTGIIALDHDIGRFRQALLGSYSDILTKFDHAQEGARMVQEARLPFHQYNCDEAVAIEAIASHSAASYAGNVPEAKLIRDADKLELYRAFIRSIEDDRRVKKPMYGNITPAARSAVLEGKLVLNKDRYTDSDIVLQRISWISDLNYSGTKQIVIEEGILEQLSERLQEVSGKEDEEVLQKVNDWQESVKAEDSNL